VRVWRDWVLSGAVLLGGALEVTLRDDVVWPVVAFALLVLLVVALLWRRTHPLAAVAVTFGAVIVVTTASLVAGAGSVGLGTMAFVLVLGYALFRWGSGRDIVLGTAIIVVSFVLGITQDWTSPSDAVFAVLFASAPLVVGLTVRLRATAMEQRLDQARATEREQLARELHDTVAHHVSAMVVRAQAGRVVAAVRPDAAAEALAVIEAEGARTLAEMRVLVGALRGTDDAELAPVRGVADVAGLASFDRRVVVRCEGDLDDVGTAVGGALYRIAQESITNAVRHARGATRIVVVLSGRPGDVRCTVSDDGVGGPAGAGFGIVGMTERATILGGTLTAGPSPTGGWVVDAVLPRGERA